MNEILKDYLIMEHLIIPGIWAIIGIVIAIIIIIYQYWKDNRND